MSKAEYHENLAKTAHVTYRWQMNWKAPKRVSHHFKQRCRLIIVSALTLGRMDRDLKREISKSLINNKTQNACMRRMPHMKVLCDRAILLRWLEKNELAEQMG